MYSRIQHAVRTRHIVICGLPCSTAFFPHYLTNGMILEEEKNVIEYNMRVLIFSTTFLILRGVERDMFRNVYRCSCKVLAVLGRF